MRCESPEMVPHALHSICCGDSCRKMAPVLAMEVGTSIRIVKTVSAEWFLEARHESAADFQPLSDDLTQRFLPTLSLIVTFLHQRCAGAYEERALFTTQTRQHPLNTLRRRVGILIIKQTPTRAIAQADTTDADKRHGLAGKRSLEKRAHLTNIF